MDDNEFYEVVHRGYCANRYGEVYRARRELVGVELYSVFEFLARMKLTKSVLDLGCGPGVPFDAVLEDHGCSVVGVDISERHVELARKNVPSGRFVCSNFALDQEIFSECYDGVMALYSVFHIPRTLHGNVFGNVRRALGPGGVFMLTLGIDDMLLKQRDAFCDEKMVWSQFGADLSLEMLRQSRFEIVSVRDEREFGGTEAHLWVIALAV